MSWWGKTLGGAFGFLVGGPLGALLGAALGHGFDRGLENQASYGDDAEQIQTAFFTALFSVMGHLAKADGRVSEDEIRAARRVMAHMQLNDSQRETAIRLFRAGRERDFPLDDVLGQLAHVCGRRRTLVQVFVEILVDAALADGNLDEEEKTLLTRVCAGLRLHPQHLEQILAMAFAAQHAGERAGSQTGAGGLALEDAYALLGVNPSAGSDEITRAYRRLMNRHHPDKLVSKGLPEEMLQLANEKTQKIKSAYDRIKRARGKS